MKRTTVEFATVVKNGVVTKIGRSVVLAPKPNFKGGSVKWAPEKYKPGYQKSRVNGS